MKANEMPWRPSIDTSPLLSSHMHLARLFSTSLRSCTIRGYVSGVNTDSAWVPDGRAQSRLGPPLSLTREIVWTFRVCQSLGSKFFLNEQEKKLS